MSSAAASKTALICISGISGGDGHTDRAVAEHLVLFLFQAAVVREELVKRSVEQTAGIPHADCVGVF